MAVTYRLAGAIADMNQDDWRRISSLCGDPLSLDIRFIAAMEAGMKQSCKFWHAIIDQNGHPVACASFSAMTLDLADLADPVLGGLIRRLPALLSKLRNLKLLVCGLPLSIAETSFALTSDAAVDGVLPVLDGLASRLAVETGANAIVYKEFDENHLAWTAPLVALGYRRISTPRMHFFTPGFGDFQAYRTALKSNYRQQINRSTRKLEGSGIDVRVLSDPAEILAVYSPGVHGLYLEMLSHSDFKFEILPIEFFQELTVGLGGKVDLIVFSRNGEVIAFGWCVWIGLTYHFLFAGMNYALNEQFDLYFNLMYTGIDRALRGNAAKIAIGQTADAFKARLGCLSEPMYALVRGVGPLMTPFIRYCAGLLVAKTMAVPPADVFRSTSGANTKPKRP